MHPVWKRLTILLLPLALLAFLLARGGKREPQRETVPTHERRGEPAPAARPEPPPPSERAPGMYMLDAPGMRVSLELMADHSFRFLTTRRGVARLGEGTWSLAGNRLTLAYAKLDGRAVGTEPVVVANVWNETSIELKNTGIEGRIVLTKRTVIRDR